VLVGSGGTLWRDLRVGRLDAVVAPAGHASPDLRAIDLGSEAWTVLVGTRHPLTGVGPIAADALGGERIAVTGHRDGAAFDRAVEEVLAELGVTAELVPGPPGPALHAAVARNEIVTLTTGSDALPSGVIARRLEPVRMLSFELLARDESPSGALAEFLRVATANARRPGSTGSLAAVA
jgi:hypothetical protein